MRLFLLLAFLLPLGLMGQCYGSFELFVGSGVSGTPTTLDYSGVDNRPVFVNRFGFGASFLVGRRTLIRTSLQFNQYGDRHSFSEDNARWGNQHDGNGGFNSDLLSSETLENAEFLTRHFYAEGMLALRYEFETYSPWRPFVEGGIVLGKYGSTLTKNTASSEMTRTRKVDSFRSLAPIGRFGVGVNYNFNRHVGVYGQPVLQYHLTSINDAALTRVQPWQLTLELGVRVFMDPR